MARSQQKHEFHEKFIWASVAWFAVLGVWNFWIVSQMFLKRSVGIPALADALWIHVAFFGFIANMIFGFSLRVLPHFLGSRDTKTWAANRGVCVVERRHLSPLSGGTTRVDGVGAGSRGYRAPRVGSRRLRPPSHENRNSGRRQRLRVVRQARLRVAARRRRDPVPCRRVPPQRVRSSHDGHRVRHPADFRRELPRAADLQWRESVEQSTDARLILVPRRRAALWRSRWP